MVPLRLSEAEMDRAASLVGNLVDQAVWERGAIGDRWLAVERLNRNQPPQMSSPYMPGWSMVHMPLMQPKIQKLTGSVAAALLAPDTMLQSKVFGHGNDVCKKIDLTFQFFLEIGGFETVLAQIAEIAATTDCAFVRPRFDVIRREYVDGIPDGVVTMPRGPIAYSGFVFDVVHPSNMFVAPASRGIGQARLVGHRYWQSVSEIEESAKIGRYYRESCLTGGDPLSEPHVDRAFARTGSTSTFDRLGEMVECVDAVVQDDLLGRGKRRYRVVYARATRRLLAVYEYDLPAPWYARFRFLAREDAGVWPTRSVGYNLQAPQLAYNHLWNILIYGAMYNAIPAVAGVANAAQGRRVAKVGPGDFVEVAGPSSPLTAGFRLDAVSMAIQAVDDAADRIVQISRMGVGQQLRAGTTATEAAALAASQAQAENDYLGAFGDGLSDMAEIMRAQLYQSFYWWRPLYGDQTPVDDPRVLLEMIRFAVAGRRPESSPAAQYATLRQLLADTFQFGLAGGTPNKIWQTTDVAEIWQAIVNATRLPNADRVLKPIDEQRIHQEAMLGAGAVPGSDTLPAGGMQAEPGDALSALLAGGNLPFAG